MASSSALILIILLASQSQEQIRMFKGHQCTNVMIYCPSYTCREGTAPCFVRFIMIYLPAKRQTEIFQLKAFMVPGEWQLPTFPLGPWAGQIWCTFMFHVGIKVTTSNLLMLLKAFPSVSSTLSFLVHCNRHVSDKLVLSWALCRGNHCAHGGLRLDLCPTWHRLALMSGIHGQL